MTTSWLVMIAAVVLAAFVPSVVYLVWIRNTERYGRLGWGRLLLIFFYGAVVTVLIAVVLEVVLMILLDQNIERVYQLLGEDPSVMTLLLACVIAPVVEECAKGLGVLKARKLIVELEHGIIFGAAVGLGFAATENLLYENAALAQGGTEAFIATVVVRSVSSALLHATSTSVLGLGIARKILGAGGWGVYLAAAIGMHSLFNFSASFGALYEEQLGGVAYTIGLAVALAIAFLGVSAMRRKIRLLDTANMRHRRLRRR